MHSIDYDRRYTSYPLSFTGMLSCSFLLDIKRLWTYLSLDIQQTWHSIGKSTAFQTLYSLLAGIAYIHAYCLLSLPDNVQV